MLLNLFEQIKKQSLKGLIAFTFLMNATAVYAQDAAPSQSIWLQMLPLALIFIVFFLLVILPQQRKAKKHREMVNALSKGEEVVTSSGIFGKVSKINDDQRTLILEIADKTQIKITKENIVHIIKPQKPQDTKNK